MKSTFAIRKSSLVILLLALLILSVGRVIPVYAVAPSNDDMASATVVGSLPYTDTVDTTDATLEGLEPTYDCGYTMAATVWYSYTPGTSGPVYVNTLGSAINNAVHVFNQSGMTLVDCDANGADSRVLFTAAAGTTYLISVGGSDGGAGSVVISIEEPEGFGACTDAAVDVTVAECDSLTSLYNNTQGDTWNNRDNWLKTNLVCTWEGVSCYGGVVWAVDLESNNLAGDLSAIDLTGLTDLGRLSLSDNFLNGDFSSVVGHLPTSLQYLYLYSNQLTGTVPAGISAFTSLWSLGVGSNLLSGDIAPVIDNLPSNLGSFGFENNGYTGTFPASLSALTNLWALDGSENSLGGDLSVALNNLPVSLTALYLSGNSFTGTIPASLAGITGLATIDLGDNLLGGDMAAAIDNLPTSLAFIWLDVNSFTGTIPAGISSFTNLVYLIANDNLLTGDLSAIIDNLPTSIEYFTFADNNLTGTIPSSIASLTNLTQIVLSDNPGLSGTISPAITSLPIVYFAFTDTFLCEPDDPSYASWKALIPDYYPGHCAPATSLLFEDDFETGDFTLWSRFNDGNGYLYPCTDAAINGIYGACVDRGTDKRKQLIDETPGFQDFYNLRFNIDMNSLSMTEGTRFRFVQVKMGAERPFFIVVKYEGGQYLIQLNTLRDDLTKAKTGWYVLSDSPHVLEINWAASSGADDGWAALYLDNVLLESRTGLDNNEIFVDTFKIGFTSRLDGKPISGIFYLDDIATSNSGHIGLP